MSYAQHRNPVHELWYGINDGVYKDSHMNWANVQMDDTAAPRKQMDRVWHGFNEAATKYLPDGRSYQTKGAAEIGSNDQDYY